MVIDYEKAKAKAFHVCKMKLAQQVSPLHIKFTVVQVEQLCDFTAVNINIYQYQYQYQSTVQVERLCDFTAVKSTGKLLYCYDRGYML